MDLATWVTHYGAWGLGFVAFLGATLVPVSSEVAVVAALKAGIPSWEVFAAASTGNALGASLNYFLGRLFTERVELRLQTNASGRRALQWSQKYGKWSLLGSWLPVVGDPVCLAAGLLRVSIAFFVTIGIGTRLLRYAMIIFMV